MIASPLGEGTTVANQTLSPHIRVGLRPLPPVHTGIGDGKRAGD